MSSETRSRSPHWPALDGWRGFTIWFAISVHAGYFTGGGVLSLDTFFALSGFLITGLLLRGVATTRRHRPPRRSGPPGAAPAARAVRRARRRSSCTPRSWRRRSGSTRCGATCSLRSATAANWRFILSGQSYFSSFTTPSPVLHMWSLAVEEQFYLFWPPIVLGVLWLGANAVCGNRRRRCVVGVVAARRRHRVGGEMASLYSPRGDVSRVYYGTDTRAQAMLVGAVLAVVVLLHGPVRTRAGRNGLVGGGRGVVGLRGAPWFASDAQRVHDIFYGRFGLLAYSFATVRRALATHATLGRVARRVLELRPMRWVGAISYEMYLWHWPPYLFLTPAAHSLARAAAARGAVVGRRRAVVGHQRLRRRDRSGAACGCGRRGSRGSRGRDAGGRGDRRHVRGDRRRAAGLLGEGGRGRGSWPRLPPTRQATPTTRAALRRRVDDHHAASAAQGARSGRLAGRDARPGPGRRGGHARTRRATAACSVWDRAILGCSIITGRCSSSTADDARTSAAATEAWQRQWPTDVAAFKPDVVVVAAGAWDIFDVQLADGRVVGPGDPTWTQDYEADVVNLFDILHAGGAPVIGVIPSCYGENTYPGGDGPPAERRDPARIRAVRQAWDAAADITGGTIAPLDDVLCPGGTADSSIRPDGAHYDGAGADRVAPAVIATAAPSAGAVGGARSVLGAHAPQPEPGELGDPRRELIGLVRARRGR